MQILDKNNESLRIIRYSLKNVSCSIRQVRLSYYVHIKFKYRGERVLALLSLWNITLNMT